MLNKSIPLLREKNKTLESMSYRDKEAAKIMRDMLFRTDFWGMSVCTYVMFTIPILGNFADLFFWVVLTVPTAVQWQRLSRAARVQSTELDIVSESLCNLCALALWLALHIFATQC